MWHVRSLLGSFAGLAVSAALAAALPGSAAAQSDEIRTANGIRYACTGVGVEHGDPQWAGFALKLVYAVLPRGALLADIRTTIINAAGEVVLDVNCPDDPWLVADLPPGRYRITAVAVGRYTKQATVTVRAGRQKMAVIHFPEEAGH